MTPTPEVQERLRRYLLGQLDSDVRETIEKDLLVSEELFEELEVVEDELIDEYLGRTLNADDCRSFEQTFLSSPERQEQFRFARALDRYITTSRSEKALGFLPGFIAREPALVRVAYVAIALALIAGAIWIFRPQRISPRSFATISLTVSQGTRADGPEVPTIKLPIREDALKIVLSLPKQSPAGQFRAELESSGNKRELKVTAQDSQSVTVVIPAAELKRGDYAIKLFAVAGNGTEQRINGSYLFTID